MRGQVTRRQRKCDAGSAGEPSARVAVHAGFASSRAEARIWRTALESFVRDAMGQELKREVTVLAPVSVGVPFLGFRIWPREIRLDGARKRRLHRRARSLGAAPEDEAARRVEGVLGWLALGDTLGLRRVVFGRSPLDQGRGR